MDFLLWTARSLHVFSVVVWFGGLMYQAVVTFPVSRVEQKELDTLALHFIRRFQPFVWMCVCTIFVTGVCLMLFDTRFEFFQCHDRWSALLLVKQLLFLALIFFSFGYARMFHRVDTILSKKEPAEDVAVFHNQMLMFGRINVGLAIAALLVAAGMNS